MPVLSLQSLCPWQNWINTQNQLMNFDTATTIFEVEDCLGIWGNRDFSIVADPKITKLLQFRSQCASHRAKRLIGAQLLQMKSRNEISEDDFNFVMNIRLNPPKPVWWNF
jgi:hypothetical protein